jgi:hypothetical protein
LGRFESAEPEGFIERKRGKDRRTIEPQRKVVRIELTEAN